MTTLVGIDYGGAAAAAVHQDRLVLVGTRGVPDLVLASKTGDWDDFALTREVTTDGDTAQVATPADGFWFQQSSARDNGFHALLQQEGLLIFGDIGESIVSPGAFTAAEVQARENSWFGSDRGRQPLISEGLAIFLQRGGGDIRGIRWTEVQRKYEAPSLKEFAGPVFERAIDIAAQGSGEGLAPVIVLVDEGGDLALCSIRQQLGSFRQFPSWATWRTEGKFAGVVGLAGLAGRDDSLVFAVERAGLIRLEDLSPRNADPDQLGEPNVDARVEVDLTEGVEHRLPAHLVGRVRFYWWDPSRDRRDSHRRSTTSDWAAPIERQAPEGGLAYTTQVDTDGEGNAIVRLRVAGTEDIIVPSGTPVYAGLAFDGEVETMPFVARTESGPRVNVLFSRIFNLVVTWNGLHCQDMEIIPSRGRPRPTKGRAPTVRQATVAGATSWEYGGLIGWQRRTTVHLRLPSECEIVSIAYRASG